MSNEPESAPGGKILHLVAGKCMLCGASHRERKLMPFGDDLDGEWHDTSGRICERCFQDLQEARPTPWLIPHRDSDDPPS